MITEARAMLRFEHSTTRKVMILHSLCESEVVSGHLPALDIVRIGGHFRDIACQRERRKHRCQNDDLLRFRGHIHAYSPTHCRSPIRKLPIILQTHPQPRRPQPIHAQARERSSITVQTLTKDDPTRHREQHGEDSHQDPVTNTELTSSHKHNE